MAATLLTHDEFRFVFSSHVAQGSPADIAIRRGRAIWRGWNVHPRLSDTLRIVQETGARCVIPAFVDTANAPLLVEGLGHRLWQGKEYVF